MNTDYHSSYKEDMVNYLVKDMPRDKLNEDFLSFLEKIDELESSVREINNCFRDLEKKYILLFSLRDFRNLFKDDKLREEMLDYIKYKGSMENEVLPS